MSIITVSAGENLQAAIDAAQPGDIITVEAGATFPGNFRLTQKSGVVTIQSSATLPARRVTPEDAPLMPLIAPTGVDPAIGGDHASNWILDGLHIGSNALGIYDAIGLDGCDNITLDRILLIGGENGQKRGIRGNGTRITLTRSHIANIWSASQDSQAFCAWDGAGPYTLTDNYLEAAGENVMFGGAASSRAENVPADILVEGNHCFKPRTWQGQQKSVKNLFELKAAKRAIIRRNTFENNWTHTQNGYAILFTVRNDDGAHQPLGAGAPWTVVEDILFEYNRILGTENGFNILGFDTDAASGQTTRITIRHNVLVASNAAFLIGGEVGALTIDHNTIDQRGNLIAFYSGRVWPNTESESRPTRYAVEDLTVTNTLAYHNEYGMIGEGAGIGTPALANDIDPATPGVQPHAVRWTWTNNVLAGENSHPYPPVTWKPTELEHRAQFNADHTLTAASVYHGQATDGSDLGATLDAPPPPEPPDPCAENPFEVRQIRWPDNYTGSRITVGFRSNRAWRTATITRPGVLRVVSADGCESVTVKPGVTPELATPPE